MKLRLRTLTIPERKYTYKQSTQIAGQTGNIGYLRGDFGSSGKEFFSSWFDHRRDLKTDEFKTKLEEVINTLRFEEYGLLKSRTDMAQYADKYPDSAFQGNYTTEYGFRVDTENHAFLLRCNTARGDYNFYCYCYVKKWLDHHIDSANQDIRFIDSFYNELFRIPDGESIVITSKDGDTYERRCRYVDECHLEIGNSLYHICEFAEKMKHDGCTYSPKETPLPIQCFAILPSTGEIIRIERYENGYFPVNIHLNSASELEDLVNTKNKILHVSKAQTAAMLAGSMFGWDTPAARPDNYDSVGNPILQKED